MPSKGRRIETNQEMRLPSIARNKDYLTLSASYSPDHGKCGKRRSLVRKKLGSVNYSTSP